MLRLKNGSRKMLALNQKSIEPADYWPQQGVDYFTVRLRGGRGEMYFKHYDFTLKEFGVFVFFTAESHRHDFTTAEIEEIDFRRVR